MDTDNPRPGQNLNPAPNSRYGSTQLVLDVVDSSNLKELVAVDVPPSVGMSFPAVTAGSDSPAATEGTTLQDLLDVASFRLDRVVGCQDSLDRPVRWVHTTELLDPAPYLRGGELVCTVGASLIDAPACRTFAAAAARADAVGLCFGLGDVHELIPPALIQACKKRELPLLQAPFGVPFIAMAEYLSERRFRAEARENQRAESLLTELLAGVRAQASITAMLGVAGRSLGGRVELIVGARTIATEEADTDTDGVHVTADLGAHRALTWCGSGTPPSTRMLEQLGRIIELAWHERDVEESLRRERTGQLILLVGDRLADPMALRPMLEEARIDSSQFVISAWPVGAAPLLALHLEGSLIGEAPGIALAVTRAADSASAAARVLMLPCGYSRSVELADAASAIAESRATLELSRRRGVVVGPDALTSLEGLLEQQPLDRLDPFIDQLLNPLISADELQGTNQVETLRSFLRNDGSLQRTARNQYLHVNTVRHRLTRIHQITGHDPLVFADRIALAIALWALDRRRKNQHH